MQVVRELQHSRSGVTAITEDGCVYQADYLILSVSIGVLQSDLIAFNPPMPVRTLFICLPIPVSRFLISVRSLKVLIQEFWIKKLFYLKS